MPGAESALWAMKIPLTSPIIFLGFVVWNLGEEPKVDKFGITMPSLVLGLGAFGLVFKELLISFLVLPK